MYHAIFHFSCKNQSSIWQIYTWFCLIIIIIVAFYSVNNDLVFATVCYTTDSMDVARRGPRGPGTPNSRTNCNQR